ncbi:UGSC family (seleno)protein [Saccharopolyspora halophila]|uniref:UGSC family (Seleno)protein n=1 Tax=Saccharopolyspora halophila TaxID=405551 RepID=A0ABN3GJH3_9PSEU
MFEAMIDPTFPAARRGGAGTRAPRPAGLGQRRIGLLANTKRNAAELLDAIAGLLAERQGTAPVRRHRKPGIAEQAPDHVLADLAESCDVVLVGVGDCGSCSASAVADGIALEAAGVPAAVICSEAFTLSADAMAALKGEAGYRYLTTPHPVAPLTPAELTERAKLLLPGVVGALTDRPSATAVA